MKLIAQCTLLIAIGFTAVSCARLPKSFYFGTYSEAEQLFNRGQYDRAIQKYQAYIDENPEGNLAVISRYYMARSHLALGHRDEAKVIFAEIIQKYPDVVWSRFSETQLKELDAAAQASLIPPSSSVPAVSS